MSDNDAAYYGNGAAYYDFETLVRNARDRSPFGVYSSSAKMNLARSMTNSNSRMRKIVTKLRHDGSVVKYDLQLMLGMSSKVSRRGWAGAFFSLLVLAGVLEKKRVGRRVLYSLGTRAQLIP